MANPSNFQQRIFVGDGSANGPSLSFLDDTQSGFYLKSSGVVALAISGSEVVNWSSSGESDVGGVFSAGDGSVSAPSFTFTSDPDTGMYHLAANNPCFAAGGADIFNYSSAGIAILGTAALSIAKTTNQFVLGTTNTCTISSTAPASSSVYTIPDVGTSANFILSAGTQTIGGAKTFSASMSVTASSSGAVLSSGVSNTNTTAASDAVLLATSAQGTGGNPYVHYSIPSTADWSHGLNRSSSNRWELCEATAVGSSARLTVAAGGTGNVGVESGDLKVNTAGKGLFIKEGSNARMGTAVLNGTTAVVVSNTSITASTRIFLTINTVGGTPASPYVSAVSAGASFSIKSTGASDSSTVAFLLVEPA